MGRVATYLLICPKRLNAFYADVASQPTTAHYSVIVLVNTVHVYKQWLSEPIKYKEIRCHVLLLNSVITAKCLSHASITKSSLHSFIVRL